MGALNDKKGASLTGSTPMSQSLAKRQRKAPIQDGRRNLGNNFFTPAPVAIRCNADLKAKYDQIFTAGAEKKIAIANVM